MITGVLVGIKFIENWLSSPVFVGDPENRRNPSRTAYFFVINSERTSVESIGYVVMMCAEIVIVFFCCLKSNQMHFFFFKFYNTFKFLSVLRVKNFWNL